MAKDTDTDTAMPIGAAAQRRARDALPAPTHDEVLAACIAFRGDYGELSPGAQDALREEARQWLLVWQNIFAAPTAPAQWPAPPRAMLRVRLRHPDGAYRLVGASSAPAQVSNGALGTVIGAHAGTGTVHVHFDALEVAVQLPSDWIEPAPSCRTEIIGYYDTSGAYVAHDKPIPVTRVGKTLCDDTGDVQARLDLRNEWVRPLELVVGIKLTLVVRDTYPEPPRVA